MRANIRLHREGEIYKVQIIIDIVIAITAVYAAAMSTINQFQIHRQMQGVLSVNMKQTVIDLPRIPDGSGGRTATPVHVFVIHMVNPGLTPVMLKGAGMILPDGKFLTQGLLLYGGISSSLWNSDQGMITRYT